jgi:hypothetical protein
VNNLQPILERLIGVYIYRDYTLGSGLYSLDYAYFARFICLMIALVMSFKLLERIIVRAFGVFK